MAVIPRSPLLDSLEWLEYAFQPAGEPPPADAAYGHQRHSATVVTDIENIPPKSCESDRRTALAGSRRCRPPPGALRRLEAMTMTVPGK